MHNQIDYSEVIVHGVIAMGGGLARALSNHKTKVLEIITNMFIGSFTGTVAALIAMHFMGDQYIYLNSAIAGSFGYAGIEGMNWIVMTLKKAIVVNIK